MKRAKLFLTLVCIALVLLSGCSSDGGTRDDSSGTDAPEEALGQEEAGVSVVEDVPEPVPGAIVVDAAGITGHQNDGFLMIVSVSAVGEPQTVLATSCFALTSDPFSAAGPMGQGPDGDRCESSGGENVFEPGEYDVLFAVIQGGQHVPERSAKVTVTIDGDVTVNAPTFVDWRGPDSNKAPGTITVNASGISGHENDGYLLVAMATLPNMQVGGLASSCHVLDGDPFSIPPDAAVLEEMQGGSSGPCNGAGQVMQFAGGDYDIQFAVIKAGDQVAQRSITVPVVVDGNTIANAPDYASW